MVETMNEYDRIPSVEGETGTPNFDAKIMRTKGINHKELFSKNETRKTSEAPKNVSRKNGNLK